MTKDGNAITKANSIIVDYLNPGYGFHNYIEHQRRDKNGNLMGDQQIIGPKFLKFNNDYSYNEQDHKSFKQIGDTDLTDYTTDWFENDWYDGQSFIPKYFFSYGGTDNAYYSFDSEITSQDFYSYANTYGYLGKKLKITKIQLIPEIQFLETPFNSAKWSIDEIVSENKTIFSDKESEIWLPPIAKYYNQVKAITSGILTIFDTFFDLASLIPIPEASAISDLGKGFVNLAKFTSKLSSFINHSSKYIDYAKNVYSFINNFIMNSKYDPNKYILGANAISPININLKDNPIYINWNDKDNNYSNFLISIPKITLTGERNKGYWMTESSMIMKNFYVNLKISLA